MIFDSEYRRQALQLWEKERMETKKEFMDLLEQKRKVTSNPLICYLACFIAWITQQEVL